MNVEYFISKKLFNTKEKNNSYTAPIFRIAILSIALSVSVMLISVMVVTGFKNEIASKIIGFGSHIIINKFSNNESYESEPIDFNKEFYLSINNDESIKNINVFATKAAVLKNNDEIHGVVLKGLSYDYDWSFFNEHLVDGEVLDLDENEISNNVLISDKVAHNLKLNVSDDFVMYFIGDPTRARKFKIRGIYSTAMEDFDKLYVLGDIQHIQNLNNWKNNEVGGFEITINNFNNLDIVTERIYNQVSYDLNVQSIKETTPNIFDWLELQDINVRIILILMLLVGAINMITTLLILILEKTHLIGILKALGISNWSVRKVFIYTALHLILKGIILGNIIAFFFAFLQKYFSIISLDATTYYMDHVPINFDLNYILLLNFGTLIVCYLILIIPSIIIAKISPVKAIRFE